jgi:hypothetical protein
MDDALSATRSERSRRSGGAARGGVSAVGADVMADIRGVLECILGEQFSRMVTVGQLKSSDIPEVTKLLHDSRLTPERVEYDLAQELAGLLARRSDHPVKDSSRLGGYGWTPSMMEEHMRRLLQEKIVALGVVLATRKATAKARVLGTLRCKPFAAEEL